MATRARVNVSANFPDLKAPVARPDGTLNDPYVALLRELWRRTAPLADPNLTIADQIQQAEVNAMLLNPPPFQVPQ